MTKEFLKEHIKKLNEAKGLKFEIDNISSKTFPLIEKD